MRVSVYGMNGEVVGERELDAQVFGVEPNVALMHQALVRQMANARLGTHATQTRGEVRGGGRKPWRQKGLGRARQGSIRSPIWRGGGIAFGPRPRSYAQDMPKKMRRAALRSALSAKALEGRLMVVDDIRLEAPRTREMAELIRRLELGGSVLVAMDRPDRDVEMASRNLAGIKVIQAPYLNVRDLLTYEQLVLPLGAVEMMEDWLRPEKAAAAEVSA